MLSILDILEDTTVDGVGFRTAIYCAGCLHHCEGCHNPQSWLQENGKLMTTEEIMVPILRGEFADVTFTGGDPMFQPEGFIELAQAIKQQTSKNIWCYTGFQFEELLSHPLRRQLLAYIDVLVDGRFVQSLKDEDLLFRGSTNQRLIDVQASLTQKEVVAFTTSFI